MQFGLKYASQIWGGELYTKLLVLSVTVFAESTLKEIIKVQRQNMAAPKSIRSVPYKGQGLESPHINARGKKQNLCNFPGRHHL